MARERLADRRLVGTRIDQKNAPRLRLGARQIGVAHPLEEGAILALEAVERPARGIEALAGDFVAAIQQQGAIRAQAGVRRCAEALDELHGNAPPCSLVSRGGVAEPVAEDPASRLERPA